MTLPMPSRTVSRLRHRADRICGPHAVRELNTRSEDTIARDAMARAGAGGTWPGAGSRDTRAGRPDVDRAESSRAQREDDGAHAHRRYRAEWSTHGPGQTQRPGQSARRPYRTET